MGKVRKVGKAPAASCGLAIAGFRVYFKSDKKGIISILRNRYGGFVSAGGAGCRFEVFPAERRQEPFKPVVLFDRGVLRLKRGDFEAVLDTRAGTGTLKAAAYEQCLDAFLRAFISFLLIRSGGFMLHSAGLVKNGRAYLFLGKSGAGKSTLSRLAASGRPAAVEVISDEINLLRLEKGRFRVYGSPFWGEMRADGRPGSWPLGGIYLLGKAKINCVRSCTGAEALKALLRCTVNFSRDPGTGALVMENAARLLAPVPFRRFGFSKKDRSFLKLI